MTTRGGGSPGRFCWATFPQLAAKIEADFWAMNGECKGRFPAKITAIGGLPAICGGAAQSRKRARDGGGGEEATVKFDMWPTLDFFLGL